MPEDGLKFRTHHGPPVQLASDELLIEELIKRERLKVVQATQEVPIEHKEWEGLMQSVYKKIGELLGDFLNKDNMIDRDEQYMPGSRTLIFAGRIVVLTALPEEGH